MKAIIYNQYGSSGVLQLAEVADPRPAEGEVLIRVAAAAVNPVDWKVREGRLKFITGRKFPMFTGMELSGVITEVGKGVKTLQKGDRVFAGLSYRGGACAEYVIAKEGKTIKIPDSLSHEIASTLAVAGVTPLQAFTIHYRVKPGDHVLVNGGAGGVGNYAIQIAKILGARVTAVCSDRNLSFVKELGADEAIDYRIEDFRLRHNTFDVVLDAASNASFGETKGCLKKGGMLIKLNSSISSVFLSLWTTIFSTRKYKMILLKNRRSDIQWMIDHITSGEVRVIIDKTFPLAETGAAQEYSMTGRARGKIVITV